MTYTLFDNYPDVLTMTDLRKALQIGRTTAYNLIKEGQIRHFKINSSIKIPKKYLIEYVENQCYNNNAIGERSVSEEVSA